MNAYAVAAVLHCIEKEIELFPMQEKAQGASA